MQKAEKEVILIRLVKLLNVVLIAIPFSLGWHFVFTLQSTTPLFKGESTLIIGLFIFFYILFGRIYDAFQVTLSRIQEMIYSQCIAEVITDAIMFMILWISIRTLPNLFTIFLILLTQLLLSILWSYFSHRWYFKNFKPKETAVIYGDGEGLENLIDIYKENKKFSIISTYQVGDIKEDLSKLKDVEILFLNGIHSHDRNIILKYCVKNGITTYIIPRIGDVIMSGSHQMHMFHLPILQVGRYNPSPEFLFTKRIMDILLSSIGLIVLSPIFLFTAIAVKSDGGPVFYKQVRLTKDGEEFEVLKFRSMRVDAEKDGVARLSSGDQDDRITKVGRFIRMIRLDEIPQLLNILKGEMSIVGPRPERPQIAEEYEKFIPEFNLRLQAKAGLTGYAQVYGKYNTTPYDKLLMDLMYIAQPSLLEDLRICFATIKILFQKESTEGVSEE